MPAFLVSTVRISEPERFATYAAAIKGVAAEFGGEPILAGPVAEVLEGNAELGERVVVTRFPSRADAHAYLESPRYVAAKAMRDGAATVELRLVEVR